MMPGEELCGAQEALYDFCLWEYAPASSVEGKLRSVNVLYRSFDIAGIGKDGRQFVDHIRSGIGLGQAVWGIKHDGKTISWEFYFYDYQRGQRTRSLPRVLGALTPRWRWHLPDVEGIPYFMFSIDLQQEQMAGSAAIETADIYIGNPGSQVSSGICYAIGNHCPRLKNFYFFFDSEKEEREILGKLCTSVHLNYPEFQPAHVLWENMRACQTTVVANKSDRDGIYFSRIAPPQLMMFIRRLGWPKALVDYVTGEQQRLEHLKFDVGFDYRIENGQFTITKSACYGFF